VLTVTTSVEGGDPAESDGLAVPPVAVPPVDGASADGASANGAPVDAGDGCEVRSRDFVQSFARGLAVMRAFSEVDGGLTLSEVARSTGLPRAAARRFLLTLETLGYVQATGRVFTLSPRVLDLAHPYLASAGGAEGLAEAINTSIPFARASRADVHLRLLPRLLASARSVTY
jgi:hypothetical protein